MGQIYTDHWYKYIILLATINDSTMHKNLGNLNLAAEGNIQTI